MALVVVLVVVSTTHSSHASLLAHALLTHVLLAHATLLAHAGVGSHSLQAR